MADEYLFGLVHGIASRHAEVTELQYILDDPKGITVTELAGGSSNHVFRVTSADGQHNLVFKHAGESAKTFEGLWMPRERIDLDYHCLEMFYEASPGATPKLYCLDTDTHTVVMEYVDNMELLSDQLKRGVVDAEVAKKLGDMTARFHKHSWHGALPEDTQKKLMELCSNEDIINVKRRFDFDEALDEDYVCNKVEDDGLASFRELKEDGFLEAHLKELCGYHYFHKQCLVHNDYYISSVMIKDGSLKIIDMEFANFGVSAMDVGVMISYYAMYYYKAELEGEAAKSDLFIIATRTLLEAYIASMFEVMERAYEKRKMMQDITDFTGYSLIRSTIFADIGMHIDLSVEAKVRCWRQGKMMMQCSSNTTDIDGYMKLITKQCS